MPPGFLFAVFCLAFPLGAGLVTAATTPLEFWFARLCFVIAGVAIAGSFGQWFRRYKDRPAASYGLMISAALLTSLLMLASIGGGLWWVSTKAGFPSLDNTVSYECKWSAAPTQRREDDLLAIVTFFDIDYAKAQRVGQLAGPIRFMMGSHPLVGLHAENFWYRCDLTNFGGKSLRNVDASFPISVYESTPTSNGTTAGKLIAMGYATAPGLKVGTGSDNRNYFYMTSQSPQFINVSYPSTLEITTLESDKPITVKNLLPSHRPEGFPLVPITGFPTASPPTPTPPTPQAGTSRQTFP